MYNNAYKLTINQVVKVNNWVSESTCIKVLFSFHKKTHWWSTLPPAIVNSSTYNTSEWRQQEVFLICLPWASYLKVLLTVFNTFYTHRDKWKSNLCSLSQLIIQLWHSESQRLKSLEQFKLREDFFFPGVLAWLLNSLRMHPETQVARLKAVDSWRGSESSTPRKFSPGELTGWEEGKYLKLLS